MSDDIPKWALERAGVLMGYKNPPGVGDSWWWTWECSRAFARYIAEHEEPPVDPFKLVVKQAYDATTAEAFGYDKFVDRLVLELRQRGMELAREQGA